MWQGIVFFNASALRFSPRAWYEYTGWQLENKKTLKRINTLIKDIERNGNSGIGKTEPLKNLRVED